MKLRPEEIILDERRFQPRTGLNDEHVKDLARWMEAEGFLDEKPLLIWRENDQWFLLDGFHRHRASIMAGIDRVPCRVFEGSASEAVQQSVAANIGVHARPLVVDDQKAAARKMRDAGFGLPSIAKTLWPEVPLSSNGCHPHKGRVECWLGEKDHRARNSADLLRKVSRARIHKSRGFVTTPEEAEEALTEEFGGQAAADTLRENRSLRHDISTLKAALNKAEKAEMTAEKVRAEIFRIVERCPEPPEWLLEDRPGGSAPGVPVIMLSDWHWGEAVRADETGGVNTFGRQVGEERVQKLVQRSLDLCFDHMVRATYPGAVICLGGDMVSGDIHEEIEIANELTTIQQVDELTDVLIWVLDAYAARFGQIFVPCVVGNHGRDTRKPRMKGRVFTNFDWLLYCNLRRHFDGDDRIQFLIPNGADANFRVYNHRFLLTHGDALGVRGGDGIIGALGPIMRGRVKLANSEAQIGGEFDTLLMGHWHQYITLPGLIVNGSLKGYDEFARLALRAPFQRPTQALFFVHQKHGITCHWPVFLEDLPKHEAEWVSWKL